MSTAVATIERQPRSVLVDMSGRYGMEPAAFEATLRATVCKGNVSREEFAAFLLVAKEYGLNPLTKELYAFPAKGGGIQPIVSIDGWARIINDHPAFDGMEFEDILGDGADVIAVTCRMFRKDRTRPVETTEYMAECRRQTDVWRTWPRRMLRHKAMIQCARYAFGFSGIVDQDEYERSVTPARQGDPTGPRRLHADFEALDVIEPAHDAETGEVIEAEVEAVEAAEEPAVGQDVAEETPADPEPGLPGLKSGADLAAEQQAAKGPLKDRIAGWKANCEKAKDNTTKLADLWARSSELRNDIEAADPDEHGTVEQLQHWWQAIYDAAEAKEREAQS